MEVVRFLVGNERRRWSTYLGIVVLVAITGAVSMASLAGARRTASAFERHLAATNASDLAINVAGYGEADQEALDGLPGVLGFQTYAAVLGGPVALDDPDRPVGSTTSLELVASVDGRFFDHDRPAIIQGELPDPARADEVLVNRTLARATGLEAGDRLLLAVFDPETYELLDERLPITITGVGVTSEEVAAADVDALQRVILTPAFLTEHPDLISDAETSFTYAWTGLRLDGGTDLHEVEAAWEDRAPSRFDEGGFRYLRTTTLHAGVQDAIRPQVVGLVAFGVLAVGLALALSIQAVRRSVRATSREAAVLRALGTSRNAAHAGVIVAVAVSLAVGALLAVAGAVALSSFAPVGPVRELEPRPGASVDLVVLVSIALGLTAMGLGTAMLTARREAATTSSPALDSGIGARLPLVAGTGVRMALSHRHTAARSAMTGAVLAALAVATTLVFASSVQHLTATPKLFGAGFDAALQVGAGYSQFVPAKLDEFLQRRDDPGIEGWASVTYGTLRIEGVAVPVLGVDVGEGAIRPSVVSGREPIAENEIDLGEETLEALDADVGDEVDVESVRMTIVGRAVLPALGQATGDHPSLGVGGWLSGDALWSVLPELPDGGSLGASAVLLDLRDGADPEVVVEALISDLEGDAAAWGVFSEDAVEPSGLVLELSPPRPPELVGANESVVAPTILSALLATGALAALGFALFASVRSRRRELAMLKALGFRRRQLVGSVAVQATTTVVVGLVVGVPVGIALGSLLWRSFAGQLGVVVETSAPMVTITAIAVGAVVAAVGLAVLPSRAAARTPAALTLRRE